MGRIYAQAECVLAWLGEATDGSNLAMQTLRNFDDTESAENMSTATDWRVDGQYDQDDLALVEMLCNREYWQRTWVIQEVLLAKKLESYVADTVCLGSPSKLSPDTSSITGSRHFRQITLSPPPLGENPHMKRTCLTI